MRKPGRWAAGRVFAGVLALCLQGLLHAQSALHVESGSAEQPTAGLQAVPATREASASFEMSLPLATPDKRGEAWFTFAAVYTDPATQAATPVTVRVPLSSTEYPYGEERSCDVTDPAHPRLTFSAGLDEKNYRPYRSDQARQSVRFSLNKYLCRVLAAPFRCGGSNVSFSSDLTRWTLAKEASVVLDSDAPATLNATPIATASGGSFDVAQCATIAPSGGLCCVQGKTTEWHCGGTPKGEGWHQVSGECFHRETGANCKE